MTEKVYFDLTLDGKEAGRVVIGLFGDAVPKTAANFTDLGAHWTQNVDQGNFWFTFEMIELKRVAHEPLK